MVWGCARYLSRKAGACKRFFTGKRGPEETFTLPLFFAGFQRTVRYLIHPHHCTTNPQPTCPKPSPILEIIAALAYKNAKNSFTLPGLGKLVLVHRKARLGRNPATGETIQIKAKKVVKFRVAKAAKDAILGAK